MTITTCTLFAAGYHSLGYQYLSPAPNAGLVPCETSVLVRFNDLTPADLTDLSNLIILRDEQGAIYEGKTKIASDKMTVIFTPHEIFTPGTTVFVSLHPELKGTNLQTVQPLDYQFCISPQRHSLPSPFQEESVQETTCAKPAASSQPMIMPNGVSVPGDFPHINVTTHTDPSAGYIFINTWRDFHPYSIIFDNNGSPIWYMRTPDGDRRRDFKIQHNGLLTMMVWSGYPFGQGYIGMDHHYAEIDSFHAVDGYSTDEHELEVLQDGHYLLIALRFEEVDMSRYITGGNKKAIVGETAIQEFTPQHEKIFEWRAWDHFADVIQFLQLDDPKGSSMRFPHMNAIDIDEDGHILLSSRHLSEVTKINRQTGEIIWRLGGPKNQFTFLNDPLDGFRNQHDIRVLGKGHYTVFDNGNLHNPPVSRAAEYVLDTQKMTATLVWEFRNPPDASYSYYMGNAQRLPSGNTHIDWGVGDRPKATEVRPDGKVVYEMDFVDGYDCYRSFRFPWDGMALKPTLFIEPLWDNVALIFNKFGDPDVDYYKIYGGQHQQPTAVLDTSKATLKHFTNLQNNQQYYFRVTAVDRDGRESDFSNEESITVNYIQPGENMIPNGDFTNDIQKWTWSVTGNAAAEWRVEKGIFHFVISNGGSQIKEIQLAQNGFPLVKGKKYLFEFDGWADENSRIIEAHVGEDQGAHINYSKTGFSTLGTAKKHYSYDFTMEDETDLDARVIFNTGLSTADVYIDNVSLEFLDETPVERKMIAIPPPLLAAANYPNPFNTQTAIRFFLPTAGEVAVQIFNILGETVQNIQAGRYGAGEHFYVFNADGKSSGIYFYQLSLKGKDSKVTSASVHKMVVIK
jgi:hypothetical protein